jgi:hypothetical protein
MPRGPKGEQRPPDMIRVVSGEFKWQPRQDVETRRRKRSARGLGSTGGEGRRSGMENLHRGS